MISFVDTLPRYRIKVIDKFVTVEDRNYILSFVGDARVVDTLGDNRRQLDKLTDLMRQIVEQQEFYVDTITLTAASSPEGAMLSTIVFRKDGRRPLNITLSAVAEKASIRC